MKLSLQMQYVKKLHALITLTNKAKWCKGKAFRISAEFSLGSHTKSSNFRLLDIWSDKQWQGEQILPCRFWPWCWLTPLDWSHGCNAVVHKLINRCMSHNWYITRSKICQGFLDQFSAKLKLQFTLCTNKLQVTHQSVKRDRTRSWNHFISAGLLNTHCETPILVQCASVLLIAFIDKL